MSGQKLTHSFLYNLVGVLLPLFITVVTVPLYLRSIGEARFGVMSLIWLLFGYFGLFDFGLSRATANKLAKLRGGNPQERSAVFFTAAAMNSILGIVAGLIFYVAALPLLTYLSSSAPALAAEIPSALPWMATLVPLAIVGGVFVGSLEAEERFLAINIQQIVGTILIQSLPLLAVLVFGPTIQIAVVGAVVARVISVSWAGTIALHMMASAGRPVIRLELGRSLLKYGGWITVTNAVSPLLVSADQFLIASALGASAVAHYAVPFSLAMKTLIFPGALTRALFPRLSSLHGDAANDLADKASGMLAGAMALICAPAIVLANLGLTFWIGADFAAQATPVAQTLLLGTWINGLAFVPLSLLQGQGRPDVVAKFHALEIIPFLAILWGCLALFGLPGAAMAWTLRVAIDAGLLFWAVGDLSKRIGTMVPSGMVLLATWVGTTLYQPSQLTAVAFAIAVFCFTMLVILATNTMARSVVAQIPVYWRRVRTH